MAAFDLLIRLAKQAVDRERRVLQRIDEEIAGTEQRISDLKANATEESRLGQDILTSGATLPAYRLANRQRIEAASAHLAALRAHRDAQLQRVLEQRTELKRYERIIEKRADEARRHALDKEQKAIDQMVMTKAGRRPKG